MRTISNWRCYKQPQGKDMQRYVGKEMWHFNNCPQEDRRLITALKQNCFTDEFVYFNTQDSIFLWKQSTFIKGFPCKKHMCCWATDSTRRWLNRWKQRNRAPHCNHWIFIKSCLTTTWLSLSLSVSKNISNNVNKSNPPGLIS